MGLSLHRDKLHCHINETSPGKEILLRQFKGFKTDVHMMSLAGYCQKVSFGHAELFKSMKRLDHQLA